MACSPWFPARLYRHAHKRSRVGTVLAFSLIPLSLAVCTAARACTLQVMQRTAGQLLDRLLGIETAQSVGHADLEFGPEVGGGYVASPWPALVQLWRILRGLPLTQEDVFVDYGSGKGRALLVAALFPFRRVIGVEVSAALNRIAARNLHATRRLARAEVQLVTADAAAFSVPADATVVYFYNPFKHEVFTMVLDRLCASLAAAPRTMTIIYTNPVMHDEVIGRGFVLTRELGATRVYTWSSFS